MRYTALIKDNLCINALAALGEQRLEPVPGAIEIEITRAEYEAYPIGWHWDGKRLRAPMQKQNG